MTKQMETDTTTEEREVLLQRATQALTLGHRHDIEAVRDQLREHREMYGGDEGIGAVNEALQKLDAQLADQSPDTVNYGTSDKQ